MSLTKNKQMKQIIIAAMIALTAIAATAQQYELASPDGKMKVTVEIAGSISATLTKEDREALRIENISLETGSTEAPGKQFRVQKTVRNSVSEKLKPEIREKAAEYTNAYNELEIIFRTNHAIAFRMFNEGMAYQLRTSEKDSLTVFRENLSLRFDAGDSARYQLAETFNYSYETPYNHQNIKNIDTKQHISLPVLVEKGNGLLVMITEADLYKYPGLYLTASGGSDLTATHPPYPKELTYTGSVYNHGQITATHDYIARVEGKRSFPWRVFAVSDDEKALIDNNMVWLLSTPNAINDISWIKPGVVMFDWWGKFNIYGVDFKAGINTETAKYFIDFCAEYGFRYFLFDDGWSPKEDLLTVVPGLDMEEVTAYAAQKGVDVMLWVIWHALESQWDEAFDLFEKWGIKGIKMDFMNRDDQPMVEFFERVAQKAAEKKMVVNFHGAYKPCGLRRKYPNVLTREGLIEFEYNGWTKYDNPEHHNLLPYIRMFTGPMDYIPGTMRNSTKDNFRTLHDYPMGQGTRAHSMALFVILNSPMTMLPDSPSDYYREHECTAFMAQIPVEWDETRLLDGKIGQYTVMARRVGRKMVCWSNYRLG
jgi:alpha-glucosidase